MKYIETFRLDAAALRLGRFLASLDPESERRYHRAAPAVQSKRIAIRAELERRHLARQSLTLEIIAAQTTGA